jgi:hypothetical protein
MRVLFPAKVSIRQVFFTDHFHPAEGVSGDTRYFSGQA